MGFTRATTRASSSQRRQSYLESVSKRTPKQQEMDIALTNLLILAPKQPMEQSSLILNTLPQRQLLTLIHNLLARNNSNPAVPSNSLRRLQSRLQQLFLASIDNLRRNTPLARLLATKVLPRQNKLNSLALTNSAGQTLRAAGAGDRAELDLRLAEGCVGCAVDDVAHQGELAAAAEGIAGDGGDDGLADGVGEVGPRGDEVVAVGGGEA